MYAIKTTGVSRCACPPGKRVPKEGKYPVPRRLLLSVLLVCCVLLKTGHAVNRALIMSIGAAYERHGISGVVGPERDTALALAVAEHMGFTGTQVKVLSEKATRA